MVEERVVQITLTETELQAALHAVNRELDATIGYASRQPLLRLKVKLLSCVTQLGRE